jgi:hypothetical protein
MRRRPTTTTPLDKAVATLKDGDRTVQVQLGAGCRMEKAQVTSALLDDEHGEHGHKGRA